MRRASDPLRESEGSLTYSYGSIERLSATVIDSDALLGEELLATDNEDESPNNSAEDALSSSRGLRRRCNKMLNFLANFNGKQRVGHVSRVILVMGVAVCMCSLLFVLGFGENETQTQGITDEPRTLNLPFDKVQRSSYGPPASSVVDESLFHPDLRYKYGSSKQGKGTNSLNPFLVVPFPTGAFWTNLVLKPTADRGLSYPVVAYPYAFKWADTMLQVSYPPLRRRIDDISVRDAFVPHITLSSLEQVNHRYVVDFDQLSVTTRFATDSSGQWESYLIQGSPYVTVSYQKATPVLRALSIFRDISCPFDSEGDEKPGFEANREEAKKDDDPRDLKWGVCSLSSETTADNNPITDKTLHGVQFLLQTQEGQTWMAFASEPIALSFDTIRKTTVKAAEPFSGVLRFALIAPTSNAKVGEASFSTSTGVRRLVYHSSLYPVSASVSWEFRSGSTVLASLSKTTMDAIKGNRKDRTTPPNRIATLTFHFETKSMSQKSTSSQQGAQEELLMLALPHHAVSLPPNTLLKTKEFDLVYRCIKGTMTPVVGDTWSYDEPLTSITFDTPEIMENEKYGQDLNRNVRRQIMENVQKDMTRVLPTFDENVYGFGKQVARLAQLAHISNLLSPMTSKEQNRTDDYDGITETIARSLHSFLEGFLTNEVTDQLLYDSNFGGMVTKAGLLNSEADFGNGWYNDHHFHYGYTLYACAVMGMLNSTFVAKYGSHVDALLYDIAHNINPSVDIETRLFFPLARHKSWFDGHSFASGLFPFGNGKSQESSSEAVNGYYGAYLWSLVRYGWDTEAGLEKVDFARLLLATEIRGAKYYWHMRPPSGNSTESANRPQIYDPKFEKNYMVGNLGMLDAVCSTWFGTKNLYVHMINLVPVTAITQELFNKTYVREEFTNVIKPLLPNVEMAWRGFAICDQAIVDPEGAWIAAQDLVSYEMDSGLSKAQVLHWISTRGGIKFSPPVPPSSPDDQDSDKGSSGGGMKSNSCETNKACAQLGLTGECCPTAEGVNLGCCDS